MDENIIKLNIILILIVKIYFNNNFIHKKERLWGCASVARARELRSPIKSI